MTATESTQECGHTKVWPARGHAPKLGERVYCAKCEDMRVVIAVPGAWQARCLSCNWHKERHKLQTLERLITGHLDTSQCERVRLTDYSREKVWVVTRHPSEIFGECQPAKTVATQGNLWDDKQQQEPSP